jgi:hypothetical protein
MGGVDWRLRVLNAAEQSRRRNLNLIFRFSGLDRDIARDELGRTGEGAVVADRGNYTTVFDLVWTFESRCRELLQRTGTAPLAFLSPFRFFALFR